MGGESAASILVVDDERIVAKDIQRTLRDLGYRAGETAASADEALQSVTQRCPDLVLMDIRIKGDVDGIDAAKILRARFGIPVVYLTAYADDDTLERAKVTEPFGYLIKPFKTNELKSTVEMALYRHAMEQRVIARERWSSTTLRSIGEAVVSTDDDGRVTFMNAVAEDLTGWRAEDALSRPLADVVKLIDARTREPLARSAYEGRTSAVKRRVGEATLRPRTGPARQVVDNLAPIVDDDRVVGSVMVLRDVGAERHRSRQLEVADRLASLATLATGVAHEINNPLSFILSNLHLAIEDVVAARGELADTTPQRLERVQRRLVEMHELLDDAQTGASRIQRIVADLKTFSRAEHTQGTPVDLRAAIEWALGVTAHAFTSRATLEKDLQPVPLVHGDLTRIGQIALQLLTNAAHAIPLGGATTQRVRVRSFADDRGRACFSVEDTGAGIAPTDLPRVFDPFFTTGAPGMQKGLGLSISHGLATSLGGDIVVDSTLGVGSTFTVRFPAARGVQPPPGAGSDAAPRGKVLVIDDEPMIGRSLERALGVHHDVSSVSSAAAGLEKLRRGERFDVILCDLQMPERTGMDLFDELTQTDPEHADCMLFMSGGATTERARDFVDALGGRHLAKPFDIGALRQLIAARVKARRAASEPS